MVLFDQLRPGRITGNPLPCRRNLILSGRLKRFTKVGGEMISLSAVEETLIRVLIERGSMSAEERFLAVIADERMEGKPRLIVFTTISFDREEANEILITNGFSRLVKIAAVQKIDEIPLMGTGKTNYRALQDRLVEEGRDIPEGDNETV